MDEGWGNIIYLILLALFGIIGSLKKKKPVAVSPPDEDEIVEQAPQESVNQDQKFDSIFEALLGQPSPEPYAQPVDEYEDEYEEEYEKEYEEKKTFIEREVLLDTVPEQKDPRESSIEYIDKPKTSSIDALQSIYEEQEEEEVELEEIDWRQAIIYKEILDRKYN